LLADATDITLTSPTKRLRVSLIRACALRTEVTIYPSLSLKRGSLSHPTWIQTRSFIPLPYIYVLRVHSMDLRIYGRSVKWVYGRGDPRQREREKSAGSHYRWSLFLTLPCYFYVYCMRDTYMYSGGHSRHYRWSIFPSPLWLQPLEFTLHPYIRSMVHSFMQWLPQVYLLRLRKWLQRSLSFVYAEMCSIYAATSEVLFWMFCLRSLRSFMQYCINERKLRKNLFSMFWTHPLTWLNDLLE